jgi:hypothetical protein
MRLTGSSLIAAMALLAGPALAGNSADTARYAALSMIGDQLTLVTHVPSVGSAIDHNRVEAFPFTSAKLDDEALAAIQRGLMSTSGRSPSLYRLPVALFSIQERMFDGEVVALPDQLATGLAQDRITRLVLLTKYRGAAELQLNHARVGSGTLEGLGFYVDSGKRLRRSDTGEVGVGFLAPFVYVQVSLVDVATRRVLRREVIEASSALSAARNQAGADAWGALDAGQKASIIKALLAREVTRVVVKMTGT